MKLLITGLNGTLAPALARAAAADGLPILAWDRHRVPPDDADAGARWLAAERPDAIAHLALGSVAWAGQLADYAAGRAIPFVFTSTAMVFHHQPDGPHRVGDDRNAQDAYGRYKRDCEDAVLAACPGGSIARIGWQIDAHASGNNMLAALDRWQAEGGRIAASAAWRPACSFMDDTAAALLRLLRDRVPGVTHVDGNAGEGHDFVRIVRALQQVHGKRPANPS